MQEGGITDVDWVNQAVERLTNKKELINLYEVTNFKGIIDSLVLLNLRKLKTTIMD